MINMSSDHFPEFEMSEKPLPKGILKNSNPNATYHKHHHRRKLEELVENSEIIPTHNHHGRHRHHHKHYRHHSDESDQEKNEKNRKHHGGSSKKKHHKHHHRHCDQIMYYKCRGRGSTWGESEGNRPSKKFSVYFVVQGI